MNDVIEVLDIVQFNCMQETENEGEYTYFEIELEQPTEDLELAINRVSRQIKNQFSESDVIYVIGYWRGGTCYANGNYEAIGGMLNCNS